MTIYDPQSEKYLKERLPGARLTLRVVATLQYQGIERQIIADDPLQATHALVRMVRVEKQAKENRIANLDREAKEAQKAARASYEQFAEDYQEEDLDPTGSAG